MATTTNRSIYNPIQHNQVTFVKTSDKAGSEAESMERYVPPL